MAIEVPNFDKKKAKQKAKPQKKKSHARPQKQDATWKKHRSVGEKLIDALLKHVGRTFTLILVNKYVKKQEDIDLDSRDPFAAETKATTPELVAVFEQRLRDVIMAWNQYKDEEKLEAAEIVRDQDEASEGSGAVNIDPPDSDDHDELEDEFDDSDEYEEQSADF